MSIDPFASATAMLAALQRRDVSSRELVNMHLERIERVDARLGAFCEITAETAREAARCADDARDAGAHGALLGLPLTLKESTRIAGVAQTAGMPEWAGHRPTSDGPIASRVRAAGACLLGTTNVSEALDDWQATNPIHGRTVNPWDPTRTPGGSTGGGAAALAAGLTPLEIGSDIGGSVRVPAAFCGIYGHRPSETVVPRAGAFPGADVASPAAVLGVQGPLARSAVDLELLLDVIVGADDDEAHAWRLDLPPPRHDRLDDFRIAIMPPMPWVTVSASITAAIDELVTLLRAAGARVATAMPELDVERTLADYSALLAALTSSTASRDERDRRAARAREVDPTRGRATATGLTFDAAELLRLLDRRIRDRAVWQQFFTDWDVLVAPITLDVAFEHLDGPFSTRVLHVDGVDVAYPLHVVPSMWAAHGGLPATAIPAGHGTGGLPLGVQLIGPYLEDRTPLALARLLEREWHSFTPPPGY